MSAISHRPGTNGSSCERRTSFTSIPTSATSSSQPAYNGPQKLPSQTSLRRRSPNSSLSSSRPLSAQSYTSFQAKHKRLKSQYPLDSPELHVEYILVASFHVDRGPMMEHQYPSAISGDEHMLAELMLPDQTHVRSQDWTIFFLHKDAGTEEENEYVEPSAGQHAENNINSQENGGLNDDGSEVSEADEGEDDEGNAEGPPLMYVLNLVNTKQDTSVKRGAVVKAMAICTRHSFLHIYKPLLLLALEDYFKSPFPETLAALYHSLNAMDLSLLPRFTYLERHILQASDAKDIFIEKFEQMIKQRSADEKFLRDTEGSPQKHSSSPPKHALPRDTHEFESKIIYNDIAIPVKVPSAISPETVGNFSLIKLIQIFSGPHASSPQPFALHPHLTSSGAYTHPIIVLVNALLTQKRVIFLGHNRPSGEVAEAVLAACSLASGGILRGFTRHAFPYTDLTKIDELLKVPGFVAGVTNPAFANHHEWWDLLCDLPSGRMKISSCIEPAPVTEGSLYFQQLNLPAQSSAPNSGSSSGDLTGDSTFMDDIIRSVASRHGEGAIRAKWRAYITKFTRISATFEQTVYGATALHIIAPSDDSVDDQPEGQTGSSDPAYLRGHGYVWPDELTKQRELTAWVSRIEGWRNTRSYYYFIQDTAALYLAGRPVQSIDIHHHHDRLRSLKLSHADSAQIYLALSHVCQDYNSICQLLTVTPESQAGLFYLSMGLFHPDPMIRETVLDLLDRIAAHEAGRHFWAQLSRFTKLTYFRLKKEIDSKASPDGDSQNESSGQGWARRS
ncbi:MesA protein [Histoplasma capsulatum var. duboisii H88]|uniref:MesA protein n=1 Tax=Ajellomyces capsulatus (strain H88) TaxID=544711 RepID=F0ULC4_AJEC8|nr:MesA protein [Histoplasma capsulatum var. duboisii H88]QSS56818.1 MesA protein [Histoplasma capsulatum var. duboisii H88]